MRVLIVDDDVMVRHVTAVTLQDLGCATCEAANGLEAIDLLFRERPDAMILDLLMPLMTGYEVLDWIGQEPRCQQLEVIILSGFTAEAEEFEFVPQVKAVLQKPLVLNELRRALEAVREKVEQAYEPA